MRKSLLMGLTLRVGRMRKSLLTGLTSRVGRIRKRLLRGESPDDDLDAAAWTSRVGRDSG